MVLYLRGLKNAIDSHVNAWGYPIPVFSREEEPDESTIRL
jgi:hypothetical protein